jgi:hypothetical protein
MTHSALRTAQLCLERAVAMKEAAERLADADEEWAAVCYFYSAYHTMKAAFIEDPVFDDPTRLSTFSTSLIPDDRYVTHHRGRMGSGPRKLGVNDIVQALYPKIAPHYIRLHMASIAVRYENGLAPLKLDSVRADFLTVMDAYTKRLLTAP